MSAEIPLRDDSISLPDGRRLAYACWGAPEGTPLLWMHGWPGSRLEGQALARDARDTDWQVVVPDRPGIGGSDARPHRTLLDWADDLGRLADALDLPRFALVGYSGGGPFALAAAHRLRDRLLTRADGGPALALVSSQVPLADPAARAQMPPQVQAVFALHRHLPLATSLTVGLMALGIQHLPELFTLNVRATLPPPDQRALDQGGLKQALQAEYQEAFRLGVSGVVHEVSLYAKHWGFALSDLPPGLCLWHGLQDRNVPVGLARALAEDLPDVRATYLPDAGHLWVLAHAAVALEALR